MKIPSSKLGEHVVYRSYFGHSEQFLYTTGSPHVLQKEKLQTKFTCIINAALFFGDEFQFEALAALNKVDFLQKQMETNDNIINLDCTFLVYLSTLLDLLSYIASAVHSHLQYTIC